MNIANNENIKLIECTIGGKSLQVVNCEHWSANPDTCTSICAIAKEENPSFSQCLKCKFKKTIMPTLIYNANKKTGKHELSFNTGSEETTTIKKKKQIKNPSFSEKAKSYIKAETSQATQGRVSKSIFNKRKEICMNCDYRVNNVATKDSIGWCKGGCGCSVGKPRSALSEKLYMPTLKCPQNKFGPENGEGFNMDDALDSIKNVAKSVVDLFKKEDSDK
jgi:hypothetical protein